MHKGFWLMVFSGEKCSQSSADAMNANRSSVLCRQKSGRKMDYLFLDKKNELGCGECGLDNGVNTTKELSDANFKMPKVMRDMLVKLVSQSPALKRDLVISGFYIGETKLKMVVLDSPCGYVTRYDAMEDVLYPEDENELYRKLSAVLRIILGAKTLMETTAYKLTNDTTNIQVGRCKFEYMVPSFIPNNINKKRKH
ncbi:unnamed protein product [Mucor circinelloides]